MKTTQAILQDARDHAAALGFTGTEMRNRYLLAMADAILRNTDTILAANAVDMDTGLVRDPLKGAVMSKDEPWDMGHRPGMEYWKERDYAINDWLDNRNLTTRQEFLDRMNDPSRYRPELPSSNRSHRAEDVSNDFWR